MRVISLSLLASCVLAAACDRSSPNALTGPLPSARADRAPLGASLGGSTTLFNPQPDPPRVFHFDASLLGEKTGGTFGVCGARGRIDIQVIAVDRTGPVLHVEQRWIFYPPDPCFPPDPCGPSTKVCIPPPCVPPDPCRIPGSATLHGIINLKNGLVDLNGTTDLGGGVHVRGTVQGGPNDVAGEVMFNPQPDPPGIPTLSGD